MSKFKTLSFYLAAALASQIYLATTENATAQEKAPAINIGLVDMERIFSEFYKTKIAEKNVEATKAIIKKEVDEKRKTHSSLLAEYEALVKKVQDPTLSEAIRRGHQKTAETKGAELRVLDKEMAEYAERKRKQLITEVEQSKAEILNEITAKINDIAKADGFDAVFDRAGLSERGFPFVVFVKDATDLSEKVVNILNANAPKTGTTPKKAN